MLSHASRLKVSIRLKGRKRLPALISLPRGRWPIPVTRCLSATAVKKTLTTPSGRNWVKEQAEFEALPLDTNLSRQGLENWQPTQDWQRLQALSNSGIRLLRAALRGRWRHVDAAVYCRGHASDAPGKLTFQLVSNMDLLDEGNAAGSPFTDHTLLLTDTERSSDGEMVTYLLQHEMVEIPSRSCALFPLVGVENAIVGLFILSFPHQPDADPISKDEMEIVNEAKQLLLSALEQYHSVVTASQATQRQKQFTKCLLKEGRGAVRSVRSYAKMLSFRPVAGTLEKDMIDGIEHQGERMFDIVQRLETALTADSDHLSVCTPFASDHITTPPYLEN